MFFHLCLYLSFSRLQLVFNLLDLSQHGGLGLLQGRELLFSLLSLLLHILELPTGGLVFLVAEEESVPI